MSSIHQLQKTMYSLTHNYINTTHQLITQHFIYMQKSIFCQGDMFRPYKVILRPSKKTDPRVVCFIGCLLWGPEEDHIRSKLVALTKYTVFLYKTNVVLSTDLLYLYVMTLRDGKHQTFLHGYFLFYAQRLHFIYSSVNVDIFMCYFLHMVTRDGAVGWSTALQVGKSWVRFPMVSLT